MTPFYPLLTFPDRDDKKFLQFERRMIDAEKRKHGQLVTPSADLAKDIDFGFEAALAEIEGRGDGAIARRTTKRARQALSPAFLDIPNSASKQDRKYTMLAGVKSPISILRKKNSLKIVSETSMDFDNSGPLTVLDRHG